VKKDDKDDGFDDFVFTFEAARIETSRRLTFSSSGGFA